MTARRDVFQAIADPTRRMIVHFVAKKPVNVNTVAGRFSISRPAISKHMRILKECGLVSIRQQGRERICEARLQKLSEVDRWVSQYRDFWNAKLDALGEHLEIMKREKARTTKSGKRIPATK